MKDANNPSFKHMTDSKLVVHLDQQEEYEAWEMAEAARKCDEAYEGNSSFSMLDYARVNRKSGIELTDAKYDSIQSSVEAAQHNSDRS